jgi:hypothetical protein
MLRYSELATSTAYTKRDVLLFAKCVSVFEESVHVFKEMSFYSHSKFINSSIIFFNEMSSNVNVFDSCLKLKIRCQSNNFLIVFVYHYRWEYSTSHVNWIMKFRSQIIFFATTICLVYSTSQMNNVTID